MCIIGMCTDMCIRDMCTDMCIDMCMLPIQSMGNTKSNFCRSTNRSLVYLHTSMCMHACVLACVSVTGDRGG